MHSRHTRASSRTSRATRFTAALLPLATLLLDAELASARPGTHPIVVSTWDSRASSVVLQYKRGLLDGGGFDTVSYNANFTSTSGKLSSQFGLHYLNFSEGEREPTLHGLSATATALFVLPVTARFENGLPRAAIGFYVGSAPTALVSGELNYLSVPFVLGLGVPVSPAKAVTITPWFELSPGVNLDTVIHPYRLQNIDPNDYVNLETGEVHLTEDEVRRVLEDSVELDVSASVGARAGLDIALHVSDYFDVAVNASLSSVGTAFAGKRVAYLGGGFVWRWDEIVPAVLPAEKRLLHESCDDIEARFRSCPNARRWRSPEERETPAEPVPAAPPTTGVESVPQSAPTEPPAVPAEPPAAPEDEPQPLGPVPAPAETPPATGAFPPAP